MSQADQIFKNAFRRHFTNHEANYPPSKQVAVGDFGEMRRGFYVKLGDIKSSFNVDFDVIPDDHPTTEQFKSDGSVSVNFVSKGESGPAGGVAANAQLQLSFMSEKSFFFSSAEVRYLQMRNLYEIGQSIMNLYKKGIWKKNFVLVSSVLEGQNTVLVISGGSGANVVIEAKTDTVSAINLADAQAKLEIKSSSQTAYHIVAPTTCQIGLGLSKVYNRFFNKPSFKTGLTLDEHLAQLDYQDGAENELVFGDVMLDRGEEIQTGNV